VGASAQLILPLLAYLLVRWIDQWSLPPRLDWKAVSDLALEVVFPTIVWFQLLKAIQSHAKIAAQRGFDIVLKPLPNGTDQERCKI